MKLRIKDNAVRFRITLEELEILETVGELVSHTLVPGEGETLAFQSMIKVLKGDGVSRLALEPFRIIAELSPQDFITLQSPAEEGVYVRKTWKKDDGTEQRFMFFVEKDRPGSACEKPEEWVYRERLGERPETRSISGL